MNPTVDIYASLKKNNLITWASVIIATVTVIYSLISNERYKTEAYNKALERTLKKSIVVTGTGEVLNTAFVNRSETMKIECSDHLEKWVDRYYDYDFNSVRTKPLRAQWLIVHKEFEDLQAKYAPWHQTVQTRKLIQKAQLVIDSIKIDETTNPISFRALALVTVSDGHSESKYDLTMKGLILDGFDPAYPQNPHGFALKNYTEKLVKRANN